MKLKHEIPSTIVRDNVWNNCDLLVILDHRIVVTILTTSTYSY